MRKLRRTVFCVSLLFCCHLAANAQLVAVGDLTGDGKPDVVIGDPTLNNVAVYLNDGSGGFGSPTFLGLLPAPMAFVNLADVNNDGFPDILVTGGQQIQILLGDGKGGFSLPTQISLAPLTATGNPVVADFNGDGIPDIALGAPANNVTLPSIALLAGNGQGGFSAPGLIPVSFDGVRSSFGLGVIRLSVVDVNKDGKPDMVAHVGGGMNRGVPYLVLNGGSGTFASTRLSNVAIGGAADFNGDGNLDFWVGGPFVGGTGILFGDGLGGILYSNSLNTSTDFFADFDANGTVDFLTDTGYVPGNGHGGIGDVIPFSASFTGLMVAVADMNGDGLPDLIVLQGSTPTVVLNHAIAPVVVSASTFINAVASASITNLGQTITIMAHVRSDGGVPVGTVSFSEGGTTLGSAPVNVYGWAGLDTLFSTSGSHSIATSFTGTLDPSTGTTFGNSSGLATVFVNNTPPLLSAPTISFTASPNPARELNPVTFTVAVSSPSGTPTGEVILRADGEILAVTPLGLTVGPSFPNPGLHNIQATYGGDGTFPPATSATLVEDVRSFATPRNPSSVTLAITPGPGTCSSPCFNLTGTLTGVSNPQGNFVFRVDGAFLTSLPVSQQPALFFPLSQGTYTVSVEYQGDAALLPSSASSKLVVGNPAGDFTLFTPSTSASVTAGQSAGFSIAVSPGGGFSSATSFSCSGLPAGSSCNFSPATVTPSGAPVSTTLTITTTARQTAASAAPSIGTTKPWLVAAMVFGLVLSSALASNRNRAKAILGIVAIAVSCALAGCSGSSGQNPGPTPTPTPFITPTPTPTPTATPTPTPTPSPTPQGTPAGTYQITVTATSSVAAHDLVLLVTVQ